MRSGGSLSFQSGEADGIVAGGVASVADVSQPSNCNVTSNAGPTAVIDFSAAAANLNVS